jgi:hypothetical protein
MKSAGQQHRPAQPQKAWPTRCDRNQRVLNNLARLHNTGQIYVTTPIAAKGGDGADVMNPHSTLFHSFHKMTGDLSQIYGLANLDTLSVKRQRTLPAACKVYDLLNFASEVATHHSTEAGNRSLSAYIGDLISGEYDLEGTVDHLSDWREFFVKNEATSETLTNLQSRN